MTATTWDFESLAGETRTAEDNLAQGEATNALVAQVLAASTAEMPTIAAPENPRLTLPGGIRRDGIHVRDAEVRELTGADEEALAAVTGSVVDWMELMLERGVVHLGGTAPTAKDLRDLLIGDRDALLLRLRIVTFGTEVTAHVTCPRCDQEVDATIDLTTVTSADSGITPQDELPIELRRGQQAVVRLPDGHAQRLLLAEDSGTLAERNTSLLAHCLVRVIGPNGEPVPGTGRALAQSLGMADRQTILRSLAQQQPGPKLHDTSFTHTCGQEVRLPLTLPELFRI